MSDDIVTRLRAEVCWCYDNETCITCEATDEIERLRAELRDTHTVVYRFVDGHCTFPDISSTNRPDATPLLSDPTRLTVSVPQAAALLGISRTAASRAYRRTGFITDGVPVMRIGKRCVVPTAALRKALCIEIEIC